MMIHMDNPPIERSVEMVFSPGSVNFMNMNESFSKELSGNER